MTVRAEAATSITLQGRLPQPDLALSDGLLEQPLGIYWFEPATRPLLKPRSSNHDVVMDTSDLSGSLHVRDEFDLPVAHDCHLLARGRLDTFRITVACDEAIANASSQAVNYQASFNMVVVIPAVAILPANVYDPNSFDCRERHQHIALHDPTYILRVFIASIRVEPPAHHTLRTGIDYPVGRVRPFRSSHPGSIRAGCDSKGNDSSGSKG